MSNLVYLCSLQCPLPVFHLFGGFQPVVGILNNKWPCVTAPEGKLCCFWALEISQECKNSPGNENVCVPSPLESFCRDSKFLQGPGLSSRAAQRAHWEWLLGKPSFPACPVNAALSPWKALTSALGKIQVLVSWKIAEALAWAGAEWVNCGWNFSGDAFLLPFGAHRGNGALPISGFYREGHWGKSYSCL